MVVQIDIGQVTWVKEHEKGEWLLWRGEHEAGALYLISKGEAEGKPKMETLALIAGGLTPAQVATLFDRWVANHGTLE